MAEQELNGAQVSRSILAADVVGYSRLMEHFSEHTAGDGAEVFAAAERMGLEGIVSKRAASRYVSGSSRNWLKTKCFVESELILIGTEIDKDGKPVALLARHADGRLAFAGDALIALPAVERDRLWNATKPLEVSRPAVSRLPGRRNARWLKPELVVTVRHLKAGSGGSAPCHRARVGGRHMTWILDEELAFDVQMALSKIAGLRLCPEARQQAAS